MLQLLRQVPARSRDKHGGPLPILLAGSPPWPTGRRGDCHPQWGAHQPTPIWRRRKAELGPAIPRQTARRGQRRAAAMTAIVEITADVAASRRGPEGGHWANYGGVPVPRMGNLLRQRALQAAHIETNIAAEVTDEALRGPLRPGDRPLELSEEKSSPPYHRRDCKKKPGGTHRRTRRRRRASRKLAARGFPSERRPPSAAAISAYSTWPDGAENSRQSCSTWGGRLLIKPANRCRPIRLARDPARRAPVISRAASL